MKIISVKVNKRTNSKTFCLGLSVGQFQMFKKIESIIYAAKKRSSHVFR